MVSLDPVSSARRFVNVFFVDQDVDVKDAVVAVRLPYDRVNISGTEPFTFLSNDVVSYNQTRVAFVEMLVIGYWKAVLQTDVRLKVCFKAARQAMLQV